MTEKDSYLPRARAAAVERLLRACEKTSQRRGRKESLFPPPRTQRLTASTQSLRGDSLRNRQTRNANQVSQFWVRVWVCRFLSEPACLRPAGASKRTHFIRTLLKNSRGAAPESSATSVVEIFGLCDLCVELKRDFFTLSQFSRQTPSASFSEKQVVTRLSYKESFSHHRGHSG